MPSLWEIAIMEAIKKVNPPISATILPVVVPPIAGDRRKST